MPQPDQEQTARKFQQFEYTSPSSPHYDADYDCEPPPNVRAELIRPKRPQILKRRPLPQRTRFKWAWCLAVVLGALLATLLLGRVLENLRTPTLPPALQAPTPAPVQPAKPLDRSHVINGATCATSCTTRTASPPPVGRGSHIPANAGRLDPAGGRWQPLDRPALRRPSNL